MYAGYTRKAKLIFSCRYQLSSLRHFFYVDDGELDIFFSFLIQLHICISVTSAIIPSVSNSVCGDTRGINNSVICSTYILHYGPVASFLRVMTGLQHINGYNRAATYKMAPLAFLQCQKGKGECNDATENTAHTPYTRTIQVGTGPPEHEKTAAQDPVARAEAQ